MVRRMALVWAKISLTIMRDGQCDACYVKSASDSQGSQMVSSICSDTVEARYAYCTQ